MAEESSSDSTKKFELLSTGKPHVSFSEVRDWSECSFRHKLKHVLKIDLSRPGPFLDFGKGVHSSCEHYLKTRVMDVGIAVSAIKEAWQKNVGVKGFEPEKLDGFIKEAVGVLEEVPVWFDETFPNWQFVDAEHMLYESIEGHEQAFKGYIDGIIVCDGAKGTRVFWLIDWKTCSWGWGVDKKTDPLVRAQLVLYKNFWSTKTGTDPKNVRCGFVLLKRTAKTGTRCELVTASVGEITTGKSLKVVSNMLTSVKRGMAIKNRSNCQWCDYRDTEHCK